MRDDPRIAIRRAVHRAIRRRVRLAIRPMLRVSISNALRPAPHTRGLASLLAIGLCLALARGGPVRTAAPAAAQPDPPLEVCIGESVAYRFEETIPPTPPSVDIVFAFDTTSSMNDTVEQMKIEATMILDTIGGRFGDARFGLASFRDYAFPPYGGSTDWPWKVEAALTADQASVRTAILRLWTGGGADGPESYSRVLFEATAPDNPLGWRPDARKALIILGDNFPHDNDINEGLPAGMPTFPGGSANTGYEPTYRDPGRSGDSGHNFNTVDDIDFQEALLALPASEITLIAVFPPPPGDIDPRDLAFPIASSYWELWTAQVGGLFASLEDVADLTATLVDAIERTTSTISVLEVDADPAPYGAWVDVTPPTMTDLVIPPEGRVLGFDVVITPPADAAPGDHTFELVLRGDGAVYARRNVTITVRPPCTATPTATLTPTATFTPSMTPTLTDTPTSTPTSTPSPTPVPGPLYLPIVRRDAPPPPTALPTPVPTVCRPTEVPVDVALLIDSSSSMEGEKLAAAKLAARAFVSELRLPTDNAAVISFDSSARVDQPLTSDRATLERAIDALRTRTGTRIDLGLWSTLEAIVDRGRADADPVIVLLTDGLPQGGSEGATLIAADFARDVRVDIWAIGLGPDVSEEVLRAIAGGPDRVRLAPSPDELVEVYGRIAREIPCR